MHSDEEGLLRAICQTPHDDLARLIYADWLEEHDQPERAEFIRLQCELDRLPARDRADSPLAEREGRILQRHRKAWRNSVPGLWKNVEFRRGFLYPKVKMTWPRFRDAWETSRFHVPLWHVWVMTARQGLGVMLEDPLLRQVDQLSLVGNTLESSQLEALLARPVVENLTLLNLSGNVGIRDQGMQVLAKTPYLPRLSGLDLASVGLTTEGLAALGEPPLGTQLQELRLDGQQLGQPGVATLLGRTRLPHLRRLSLSQCALHDVGAQHLLNWEHLPRLESLMLNWNGLSDDFVMSFVLQPAATGLRELHLSHNDIGPRGAQALCDSPYLHQLALLRLEGNPQLTPLWTRQMLNERFHWRVEL